MVQNAQQLKSKVQNQLAANAQSRDAAANSDDRAGDKFSKMLRRF
jgi:hypothetical protein